MIALYRRLVPCCQTVNELNRLHIALENRMSPLELDEMRSAFPRPQARWLSVLNKEIGKLRRVLPAAPARRDKSAAVPPASREWIRFLSHFAFRDKPRPEPFVRRRLDNWLTLYESAGDKPEKTIAVCYTGKLERPMMPLPIFLQHLDSGRVDVVLLRDPTRNGYRHGIRGAGDNLHAVMDALEEALPLGRYGRRVALGTSAGGLPAVLTAMRLGFDAALSVGANAPDDPRWRRTDGTGPADLLRRYLALPGRKPAVFLAFGEDTPGDRGDSLAIASMVDARLFPYPTTHNVLWPLVKEGRLGELLDPVVYGEAASPR